MDNPNRNFNTGSFDWRQDLMSAADSVTDAMSSLVLEYNGGEIKLCLKPFKQGSTKICCFFIFFQILTKMNRLGFSTGCQTTRIILAFKKKTLAHFWFCHEWPSFLSTSLFSCSGLSSPPHLYCYDKYHQLFGYLVLPDYLKSPNYFGSL